MFCTAAPIRNIQGQLAGILDISSEGVPFKFDPTSVVGLYAASIENRLLVAQSNDLLIIRFQFLPAIIETPMVAILGFDFAGQLVWLNSVASHLLGIAITPAEREPYSTEHIFDASFEQLASQVGQGSIPQRLLNGLQVFITCELRTTGHLPSQLPSQSGGHHSLSVAPRKNNVILSPISPSNVLNEEGYLPADSLKQADADLIQKFLSEYRGNVSKVAKRLKVSRGLIYRRLQELRIDLGRYK
jgi:transcriptional regulator of acetoin/glycerol metabolism